MNNTPIQSTPVFMHACIKRMLAAVALIIALTCPHAKALESSPHWEEIDGVSRYGYWQEGSTAGYWDETAGYWDYSAGNGHFETIYSNPVYDEEGNFVSEDSSQLWVLDPEWVSAPQYVDQSTPDSWLDLEPPQNDQDSTKMSFGVILEVSNPYQEEPPGFRARAWLEWTVDDQGKYDVSNYVVELGSRLGPFGFTLNNSGNQELIYTINAEDAHLHWSGHVWSPLDLSVYLPWTDAAVDWDLDILMDYPSGIPSGSVIGVHDRFPNFHISINGMKAYEFATFLRAGDSPVNLLDSDLNIQVSNIFKDS